MKNLPFLRRYFGFSAGEARGFALLLILMFALLLFPLWLNFWLPNPGKTEQEVVRQTRDNQAKNPQLKNRASFSGIIDLNTTGPDSLILIGLPHFLANRIVNYRSNGGYFKSVNDLKKIYGMTDEVFNFIKPHLKVSPLSPKPDNGLPIKPNYKYPYPYYGPQKRSPSIIDINLADSTDLELLPEIGPASARRIIEYRKRLGGFIHPNQIYEVWGIDSFQVASIWPFITLKPTEPFKINVNSSQIEKLKRHPYAGYRTFKLIDNFRRQKGQLTEFDDLFAIKGLDSTDLLRLKPYIEIR